MDSSLGLSGDGDDVDLIHDIEQAFGLTLPDSELRNCLTVGDVFAQVAARLPADPSATRCGTAMAFYQLRRAFQPRVRTRLRPETPLSALKGMQDATLHRIIAEQCNLSPPALCMSLWGCIALAMMFAMPVSILVMGGGQWIALSSAFLAVCVYRQIPLALPERIATFGDLAREVSARSIGMLSDQGARLGVKEAWDAFRFILADHTALSKAAIAPETLIYQPKPSKP